MLYYGVLASGILGLRCVQYICQRHKVNFVFTDKQSTAIIAYCKEHNIPVFSGNPGKGSASSFLEQFKTDVLLSVNYLFIVDKDIIGHPKEYAINFHGSLLPKYRGRTPHVWAIINNETETGITAHLMTEDCDAGDIVYQEKIPIGYEETGGDILNVFKERYEKIVAKVIEMAETGTITPQKQDDRKATYFGKRTPGDGEIDWNWQKERIRNWVRAQAKPYPGAFSFYQGEKVTIHRVEFCDNGFNWDDENGTIVCDEGVPVVKTSNGAVCLMEIETEKPIIFKKGEMFHGRY